MAPNKLPEIDGSEIPIAARIKGPGPAAYSLPATIGPDSKLVKVKAPAYSFGIKPKDREGAATSSTPGPNLFFPQTTRFGDTKGPAFTLKAQHKPLHKDELPGPGAYDPNIKYTRGSRTQPPAYSMGRKAPSSFDDHEHIPGPGSYTVGGTVGRNGAMINIPSAAAYTMKPLRPIKTASCSPGPAAYGVVDLGEHKASRRGGKLPERVSVSAPNGKLPITPGPNHYDPNPGNVKAAAPQFSFRVKHSDYEYFLPESSNEGELIF